MVMAAVITTTTEAIADPDTGDLARDLKTLLRSMRDNFGTADRATMLGMLAELDQDASESLRALIFMWGADLVEPLVARAKARGELGPEAIPTPILALPLDLARHELCDSWRDAPGPDRHHRRGHRHASPGSTQSQACLRP